VLGHHCADAEVGALDPADGTGRREGVHRWFIARHWQVVLTGFVERR
jgi:hypothetical protein